VLVGAGRVGHGQGGLGSGVVGEAPARAEQVGHGRGGPGWAREVGVGCHWRGDGCGSSVRSSWWWRWHTSLYSAWKRCERERERSGRKKGRGRVYSLMFVGPTHQPTNISGLAYMAVVVPYVCQPLDEHKLHTSV
jgi:hypothetical protein